MNRCNDCWRDADVNEDANEDVKMSNCWWNAHLNGI